MCTHVLSTTGKAKQCVCLCYSAFVCLRVASAHLPLISPFWDLRIGAETTSTLSMWNAHPLHKWILVTSINTNSIFTMLPWFQIYIKSKNLKNSYIMKWNNSINSISHRQTDGRVNQLHRIIWSLEAAHHLLKLYSFPLLPLHFF